MNLKNIIFLNLLLLIIFAIGNEQVQHEHEHIPTGKLSIDGDLVVTNTLGGQSLQSPEVQTHLLYSEKPLKTSSMIIDKANVDELILDTFLAIDSNSKLNLEIDADIIVQSIKAHDVDFNTCNSSCEENNESSQGTNFLQTKQVRKNWALVSHDHFQDKESFIGWNIQERNFCKRKVFGSLDDNEIEVRNLGQARESLFEQPNIGNKNNKTDKENEQDYFLGGHCLNQDFKLTKNYAGLTQHKQIRISAQIHLFDKWEGEKVYLLVDGKQVWQKISDKVEEDSGIDICGGSYPDHSYGLPIDIIVPHKNENVTLSFQADVNSNKDSCSMSFAIDDVMIYLK